MALPRVLQQREVPGTMRASSPTEVCDTAEGAAPRLAADLAVFVGADSISARGCLRRRVFPGWSLCFPPSCRAGVHAHRTLAISKIGTLRRRRVRRDEASRPTDVRVVAASRLAAGPTVGRRGGIYPSRGHLRQREVPGTMRASSPTEVCGLRRRAFKSWLARLFKNAPALAGAILLVGQPGPRHPRPKKQSAGLFFCGLRRRAFKSWLARLFKNAPALAGAILLVGQPGTTPPTP